jgi:prepilin-type N-terminal cleavage/methylation domain-containing protein
MIARRLREVGRQDGFTLTEMLVSILVLGLLMACFSLVFSSALRHSDEIEEQSDLQAEVRPAIDRFAQDLRQAYSGNSATVAILSMSSSQITFYSPDRLTPFHLRKVSYRVNGGNFERALLTSTDTDGWPWVGLSGTPSNWSTLAGSVVSASAYFRYYDVTGAELNPASANPADVRTVNLKLVIATNTSPSRQVTYETSASVRAF